MAETPIKTCAACGQAKPVTDFHKHTRTADGMRSSCKPCVLALNRQSVLRHHEKRKAEKREVYQRVKNTPEYQAYVKAQQIATKEKKREYDRRYRASKDRAVLAARALAWNRNNPDKRAAIVRNNRDRRRAKIESGITSAKLAKWTTAQPKVCYWCSRKCAKGFHVDHYVPLSKGGLHEISNLVISCAPCNLRKNAKDPLDFAREVGRLL